jgi:hypothetical protein
MRSREVDRDEVGEAANAVTASSLLMLDRVEQCIS